MLKRLSILSLIILFSCSGKPNFMKFEVVFYAPLGTNYNEIGSNISEIKENCSNQTLILNDYINVSTSFQIYRNRLYIADRYNKRITIFSLGEKDTNVSIIPNKGEGYEFDTPVSLVLNKYGEIYVLATVTNRLSNTMTTNSELYENLFYVYKFSPSGKFIYCIGESGINSTPFGLIERIDIDLFNNLYVYVVRYDGDYKNYDVKRFSISGELTFEFDTKYIPRTNVINNETYIRLISSIFNLKNNERLIITSQNYMIGKDGKNVDTPSTFYNSVDVYSILRNSITKNIFKSKKHFEDVLAVTYDDVAVLYSYDERAKGIKFRFLDLSGTSEKETVYYAPQLPSLYLNSGFFVDKNGEIYSTIVKDEKYFVIIRWKKVKSRS
ncbi:MAG: hypothetical protein ACP5QT_08260 [Brevinematia bacterium]